MATAWKSGDKNWMWVCERVNDSDFSCINFASHPPSSISAVWGRCLELNKVTLNSTFSYEIAVRPYKKYPEQYADKIMKRGSFKVEGKSECEGDCFW